MGYRSLNGLNPKPPAQTVSSTEKSDFGDRVDLSEIAVIVTRLKGTPSERLAKILSIKRELDLGTYVTDAKLKAALLNMVETLANRNYGRR